MKLIEVLNYENAARVYRWNAANWVLQNPETFKELLVYCFKNDPKISHKANWVLEIVCVQKIDLLYPNLDYFFEHLCSVQDESSLRALAHICEILCVKFFKEKHAVLTTLFYEKHKEKMTICCFDWLITHKKVATQARALTCLFYLGTEQSWIYPELKIMIEENLPNSSAGYKARGKNVLDKIRKWEYKKLK